MEVLDRREHCRLRHSELARPHLIPQSPRSKDEHQLSTLSGIQAKALRDDDRIDEYGAGIGMSEYYCRAISRAHDLQWQAFRFFDVSHVRLKELDEVVKLDVRNKS